MTLDIQRGCRLFPLPEKIKFRNKNSSLFELFGAFFCEGLRYRKKRHNLDRLSFSNADPDQISWFIDSCSKLFSIPKKCWKAQVLFPSKKLSHSAVSAWLGTGLNKNHIIVSRNKSVNNRCGVCILYISNSTLAEFFYALYEKSKDKVLFSKLHSLEFFRGISRGDLGVSLTKDRIRTLIFSTKLKEDVEFFISLSNNIGIKISKPYFSSGCWNSVIHDYTSFVKLARLNAITHRGRKLKFLSGLLNANKNTFNKYLVAVGNRRSTSKEVSKRLNISIITSRFYLSKLTRDGLLDRTQLRERYKFFYSLSDTGKSLLKFHKGLIQEVGEYGN